MADTKISDLTAKTTPVDTDVAPIVDTSTDTTKKVTWANIKATLKAYFDTLYPSGSGTSTGTNTGDQTLSDATITSSDITTNNVTSTKHGFAPKSPADATQFLNGAATPAFAAVKDSDLSTSDITTNNVTTAKHGFVVKAPNDTTKFFRGDATWAVPAAGASTPTIRQMIDYSNTARVDNAVFGSGTVTFSTYGVQLATTAAATSAARIIFDNTNGGKAVFNQSPAFSCIFELDTKGTTAQFYTGLGYCTVAGTGITFTVNHIGFKVVTVGSVASLYATQGDGSTETASAALTTVTGGDVIEVYLKVNGSSSVDYYWRVNGGALSAATNLTTNMPTVSTATSNISGGAVSNQSTASATTYKVWYTNYER